MKAATTYNPEGMNHVPAYFRSEVARAKNHPILWLLESFEANLHLTERIIENSGMLFDPEEIALFPDTIRPPMLAFDDLADVPSLVSKLEASREKSRHPDKVSQFIWQKLSETEHEAVANYSLKGGDQSTLQSILVQVLNTIILGPPIDESDRFAEVKFSKRTRHLRALKSTKPKPEVRAKLNRLLLQDAYPREILALPETPALDAVNWQADWLKWLASLIALDLDQEWFADGESGDGLAKAAGTGGNLVARSARAAAAIKQAVELYHRRGTPTGLTDLLQKLHGWDIEIFERSWPRGMEIGETSTIGVNTWLTEDLDEDFQFTVIIKASQANLTRLGIGHLVGLFPCELVGEKRGTRIEALLDREKPTIDKTPGSSLNPEITSRMAVAVTKLRDVIDSEKPAHLRYHLALEESGPAPAQLETPHQFIGIDSVIGHFWIN
jgi:hypothetical protein